MLRTMMSEALRQELVRNGIELFRAMAAGAAVEVLEVEATPLTVHRGELWARCRHQDWEFSVRALRFGRAGGQQTDWRLAFFPGITPDVVLACDDAPATKLSSRCQPPLIPPGSLDLDARFKVHTAPPEAARALNHEAFRAWLRGTPSGWLLIEQRCLELGWTGDFESAALGEALAVVRSVREALPTRSPQSS
jgi:hypothetical protein